MDIVERMKAMLDAGDAVGGISRVFVPADDVRDLLAEIERLRALSEPVRDGYVSALNDIRSEARMAQQDLMQADDEEVNGRLNVIMRIVDRAMLSASPKQEDSP